MKEGSNIKVGNFEIEDDGSIQATGGTFGRSESLIKLDSEGNVEFKGTIKKGD